MEVYEEAARLRAELEASRVEMQALAEGAVALETTKRTTKEEFEACFF